MAASTSDYEAMNFSFVYPSFSSPRDVVASADSIARKGDLKGAIKVIDDLLASANPAPILVQAEACRIKAAAELGLHLYESAVVSCNMSLDRCPAEPATLRLKSRALLGLKSYDSALGVVEEALLLDKSSTDSLSCKYTSFILVVAFFYDAEFLFLTL